MKLSCGETPYERNKYKLGWHRTFALLPARIGANDCRWLEYVERKYEFVAQCGLACGRVEYRIAQSTGETK